MTARFLRAALYAAAAIISVGLFWWLAIDLAEWIWSEDDEW